MSRTVTWQRVPTPVTPMILLVADFANGAFEKWRTGQKEDHPIALEDLSLDGVDFRFRYHYPKAEEKTAKSAAGELKKQLESQGAVNVKLDPVPIPAQTTRSLEIVKARTLTEKAKLLWAARGLNLSPDEETICAEMIERLQTQFGFGQRLTLDAGIHVKNTRMKGWRCFPEEVSFDFDAIEGEVIAVGGPNGVGKSLFWELAFPGAIFRELPTHGNIGDHALARDTFVQTNFEYNGGEFTVSQIIDGKSGSGSSSLTSGGRAVVGTETALRTDYDKWAEKNLPPFTLVKSTTFMPQESKGILGMGTKDRKALILRAKGAERYEVLAEESAKQSTATSKEALRLRGQMEGLGAEDVGPLQVTLTTIESDSDDAKEKFNTAEADLTSARRQAAEAEQERNAHAALVLRRDDLANQVAAKRDSRTQLDVRIQVNKEMVDQKVDIKQAAVDVALLQVEVAGKPTRDLDIALTKAEAEEQRLGNEHLALIKRADELILQEQGLSQRLIENDTATVAARAVVADRDAIRKAVAESFECRVKLKTKEEEASAQLVKAAELNSELNDIRFRINNNARRGTELTKSRNEATIAVERKAEVLESVAAVVSRTKDIETVTAEARRYSLEVEHLQSLIDSAASAENKALRTGHEDIIAGADPIPRAERAIASADDVVEEASDSPALLVEAKKQLAGCGEVLKQFQTSLSGHQVNAARLPHIEAQEKVLAEAVAELVTVEALQQSLIEESNQVIEKQDALTNEATQTRADIVWMETEIQGRATMVARAELLATADVKIQGLTEQAFTIRNDCEVVRTTLTSVQSEAAELKVAIDDAMLLTKTLRGKITANQAALDNLDAKIKEINPTADKATMLAIAEANQEQLLHQLSGLDKELEYLERRHDEVECQVDKNPPPELVDLQTYDAAVNAARAVETDLRARLAVASQRLADAEQRVTRHGEISAQVKTLERMVDRWDLIERTLGRDGLQAEDVAAAGDEINELANELLHASGAEYTVDVKTTRITKDGKREVEGCPIYVHNSQTREWQEGATLSPGQRAFVNLPLSLALAMIGCADSSVRPTLFQDEPTSGLDPERRPQYVAMMRYAVRKVKASKIFFITHNEELIELADSRISIEAGKLLVSSNPYFSA